MMAKIQLMGGVAALAILASGVAAYAQDVNAAPQTNAELQARIDALETEVQSSEMRDADAFNNPPPAPTGWWSNTSISGRMYYDATNITHKTNGAKTGNTDNGTSFDIKRFYVGIDHTFDPIFSANITTDVTYDATTAASQIFIKKAYLQAKLDPLLTIRVGSADLPWIPYAESLYGYRYLENTVSDRTKFGTSADWGVHILGGTTLGDLAINYAAAAINGAGYKKIPIGAGANRAGTIDLEGRISAVYQGFNLGVGGYTGKLGTAYGTATSHTANRFNAVAAYVADGFRVGVEYFNASDFTAALVTQAAGGIGDSAHGVSAFASYNFVDLAPQWSVFGRYDSVTPNAKTAATKTDDYYTFGVSYSPVKIVDLSLAYKHEGVSHGTISTSNGTIGGSTNGTYNEIGIWGDFQF